MIHALKILPGYFEDVISGKKTFEIRKNDRDYQVGDLLALNEWDNQYTGRFCLVKIDYILSDKICPFVKEDYVVMSIKPCSIGVFDGYDPRFDRNIFKVPAFSREVSE